MVARDTTIANEISEEREVCPKESPSCDYATWKTISQQREAQSTSIFPLGFHELEFTDSEKRAASELAEETPGRCVDPSDIDSKHEKFRVDRDESGRPAKVYDENGKVVRSIEYNEDGTIKQIESDDPLQGRTVIRPTSTGSDWSHYDEDGNVSIVAELTEKVSIDDDGNVILKEDGYEDRVFDPAGGMTETEPGREDWAKRIAGGRTETDMETLTTQILDHNGKPLRTIHRDEKGISMVEDADGVTFFRNEDGTWSRSNERGEDAGTLYNLDVDGFGNVTYEMNYGGFADERVPEYLKNVPRRAVTEFSNGRTRQGAVRSKPSF